MSRDVKSIMNEAFENFNKENPFNKLVKIIDMDLDSSKLNGGIVTSHYLNKVLLEKDLIKSNEITIFSNLNNNNNYWFLIDKDEAEYGFDLVLIDNKSEQKRIRLYRIEWEDFKQLSPKLRKRNGKEFYDIHVNNDIITSRNKLDYMRPFEYLNIYYN